MTSKILNGVIQSVSLGYDRGIFLCPWLHISGESWGCGLGGFVCDRKDGVSDKSFGPSLTGFFIMRVLDTLEVEKWEDLAGVHLRAETEGIGGVIIRIGHWSKDQWFNPREELKEKAGR